MGSAQATVAELNEPPMIGRAGFDRTGRYRYTLSRTWEPGPARTVAFCLLNPSTADAHQLDPTLTRCLAFSRAWGFGRMLVVNAFALRSTDPAGLRAVDDPVGPGNDAAIRRALRSAERFVVGWGNHGELGGRDQRVRDLIRAAGRPAVTFGLTQTGQPKHPLYLRRDAPVVPFRA